MTEYRLSSAAIQNRIDRRLFVKGAALAIVFILAFYFAVFRLIGFRLIFLVIFGGCYWLYLEWMWAQTRMKQVERARHYKILHGEDSISWHRYRKKTKRLNREEIKKIEQTEKVLVISPRSRIKGKIVVPKLLENFETLELKLGEWHPITIRPKRSYFAVIIGLAVICTAIAGVVSVIETIQPIALVLSGLGIVASCFSFLTLLFGINTNINEDEVDSVMLGMLLLIFLNGIVVIFEMFFQ